MSRISGIINDKIDFLYVDSWVDFGTGNGVVVNELKWNSIASEKIAIEKFPQEIGNNWKFVDDLDSVLNKRRDLFSSFDSIEHLAKEEGILFLKKIEPWFRCKLFFTPRGFLQQDEITHPELMKINPWQKHLCGWDENDFAKFGYTTIILPNFHYPPSLGKYYDALIAYKIDSL
jgi:hypothetical protein